MYAINKNRRNRTIRIKSIYLENFKNVKKGEIICECGRRFVEHGTEPDIVGLYGQNGSGKTSVIQALSLLKEAVSGLSLPDYFSMFINEGAPYAFLCFTFDLQYSDNRKREVIYSFKLKRKNKDVSNRILAYNGAFFDAIENLVNSNIGVGIYDECIQMSGDFYDKKIKKQVIIDTTMSDNNFPFGPASKRPFFLSNENKNILNANKISSEKNRSSFIFENDTMMAFSEMNSEYFDVLEDIIFYVSKQLYIISTTDYGMIQGSKVLPLYTYRKTIANLNYELINDALSEDVRISKEDWSKISNDSNIMNDLIDAIPINYPLLFPLNSSMSINEMDFPILEREIEGISTVLKSILPGTEIFLKKGNETIDSDGQKCFYSELRVINNGKEMPLMYESDGTLKIISMLNAIIMAYNDKSVTVAIDELDSGVFEYLLGEILQVFEEGGRGQLFFTSHNLRPLEVLNKKYLYFTTTDENNRYVHLKNIGKTNNLRNVYFREILEMDGDDIKLYAGTQKYKIAAAFRKAGSSE